MLETLDPADRLPAAPGDQDRRASRVAAGPRHAAGRADHELAITDRRACDGPSAPAADGSGAAVPWSSDWVQLGHELRTPLNAMLGNIELLLDGSAGPLAAPVRACVGDIQMASRQLLRQLQPLLLLVQARTAGAVAGGPPVDLLALVRQAAADVGPAGHTRAAQVRQAGRAAPHVPEDTCLMMAGDPVWLGALAAALIHLHAASPQAGEPWSIDLAEPGEEAGEEPADARGGPGAGAEGIVLRASWQGLEPASLSPLSLALIDAALALHGGRIRSLDADGLRLDLAGASVVGRSTSSWGRC